MGHSSFKIRGKQATVVTDPYHDFSAKYSFPKVSADIITVSHDHEDHNNVRVVKGTARREEPFVITGPGEYEISEVIIWGTASYHDKDKGSKRGKNTIYVINIDSIRLVHLGDLGQTLTDKQLGRINGADVLFLPVGGNYTISPKPAAELALKIQPKILVPMHYQEKGKSIELGPLEDFIKEIDVQVKPQEKLVISRESLPEETEVVVFKRK